METHYAKIGDAHVAYRTLGDGPTDLLLFMGEYLPVDAFDEEPRLARAMRRLSSLGRVILFNRRGVGLSDPHDGPPTQEQCVEDALAVLDDLDCGQAVAFGWNIGGPATMLFAADHPERTSALVLINTAARLVRGPDYPMGYREEAFEDIAEQTTATDPVDFDFLSVFAPSVASDERFRAWWEQTGQRGASPARARPFWALLLQTDVRDALGRIAAPTLVIDVGERSVNTRRYVADHIEGSRYVQLPGRDLIWWVDSDAALDEVETFLSSTLGSARRARRALASVLFVDVVTSTERAASLGDRRWRDVIETYHDLVRRQIVRFDGQHVGTEGDGVVATFPMPADAIRCACSMTEEVRALGVDIRAGIHTGEIEILADDVAGIGVHIAARVMSVAAAGEVLVSRTVSDLVTGSGIAFEDRGEHELKGVPGRWPLFAVKA